MGLRVTWLIGVTPSELFLNWSFAGMLRSCRAVHHERGAPGGEWRCFTLQGAVRLTAPSAFANAAQDAVHQAQIGDA